MNDAPILPYRTSPAELIRWVEARARGRPAGAGRGAAERGVKGQEGAAATAAALGLAGADGGLTEAGRRLALADEEERRELLRESVLGYPPFREALAEVRRRGDAATTSDWLETWWSTRGVGNSGSNRREGAATFGRLAEWVGLGRYVPGRRGHPTRIEWAEPPPGAAPRADALPPAVLPAEAPRPEHRAPAPVPAAARAATEMNRLAVPLEGGVTARLELPLRLPSSEKRRLLQLLDLLIGEE